MHVGPSLSLGKVTVITINHHHYNDYPHSLTLSFSSSSSADDDRYILPKTKVPTYHYQDSLPRLPIPKLEDTCRRYLDAQKPLLTPEQYEETKRVVEKFQKQEGQSMCHRTVQFLFN